MADARTPPRSGCAQIVVPIRNEGDGVVRLHDDLKAARVPYDVLTFVYDSEDDTSAPFIRGLLERDPRVKALLNDSGRGVVQALRHAFARSLPGPVVVVMGDRSDELGLIPEMIAAWARGATVVCPSRYVRGGRQEGGGLFKKRLSRVAGRSLRLLGFPVSDPTNNFKLYDGEWLARTPVESRGGFEVALELCYRAFKDGLSFAELPTVWKDRTAGASKFRIFRWLPHYLRWYVRAAGLLLGRALHLSRRPSPAARKEPDS